MSNRPDIIEKYWYSIDWDVQALWALDLPEREMPISQLDWHMQVPLWPVITAEGQQTYRLTPDQVLQHRTRYGNEYARITKADLNYPVEVIQRSNHWMILDGCHRLARAIELEHKSIKVREVPWSAVTIIQCL